MRDENKVYTKEDETVCILTLILMNTLLLALISQAIRIVYSVLYDERVFQSITFNNFLH